MDRFPNLSRAHDERFENINKSPEILSTVKRTAQVNFGIQKPRGDDYVINKNSQFQYSTGTDILTTKRRDSSISMNKSLDRNFSYTKQL